MRQIHIQWLHLLTETPLITRLEQFNDSPSGVAAFLDELETREIKIPMLSRIPDLAEYGRPLTRYLLFLHEIDTSMILVPHVHDELIGERVRVEVRLVVLHPSDSLRSLHVALTHYVPTGGRYYKCFLIDPIIAGLLRDPRYMYDYTTERTMELLGYTPSHTGRWWWSNGPAVQNLPRRP